jgi:hypothetical protein
MRGHLWQGEEKKKKKYHESKEMILQSTPHIISLVIYILYKSIVEFILSSMELVIFFNKRGQGIKNE